MAQSLLVLFRTWYVTFRTRPSPPPPLSSAPSLLSTPGHTLMRAPVPASDRETLKMVRFSAMSYSWAYWPSEPTEMPCEPLQMRFCGTRLGPKRKEKG